MLAIKFGVNRTNRSEVIEISVNSKMRTAAILNFQPYECFSGTAFYGLSSACCMPYLVRIGLTVEKLSNFGIFKTAMGGHLAF